MNFDRVAPHYRWLETLAFGNRLQEARTAFVRKIPSPRRVLILGEGNGRFVAEFVRAHPAPRVDCIDASCRMIALAQQRVNGAQVQFVNANVRDTALEAGTYDLIVTHFFLDCFAGAELCEVVKKVAAAATVDASWLLADFHFPDSGWRRFHASLWIRAMYLFFRLTTGLKTRNLDDPSALLCESGFQCVRRQQSRFRMIKSELWRRAA